MRDTWIGEIGEATAGRVVEVSGWVERRRDHGGLLFWDVRDRTGKLQVVFTPETGAVMEAAAAVRVESAVSVRGTVVRRGPGLENPKLATGTVELRAQALTVEGPAEVLPIDPMDPEVDEALRLRYRYLDLRRRSLQSNLRVRHRMALCARNFLDAQGFVEVETPTLARSTPEGARDFLVPSRLSRGAFYALPQSPQIFKQLLMVAGMERYFQLARAYRDEDLRADRQPEFTQIDIEASFVDREYILDLTERLLAEMFRNEGFEVPLPFPRLTHAEALDRYGTDKPDLRFDLPIADLDPWADACGVEIFTRARRAGGVVRCLRLPRSLSRRELAETEEAAQGLGLPGLGSLEVGESADRGPIARHLRPQVRDRLLELTGAGVGDTLLFAAGERPVVCRALGALRLRFGQLLELVPPDRHAFAFVVDFPLFELDENGQPTPSHHPFTAPHPEDRSRMAEDPLHVRSLAYDAVLDGVELASGSIRIHQRDVQEEVFRILGMSPAEAQSKFGFLLDAFRYGPPPHGGIALGFDRMVMLATGAPNIREVLAFPKNARGYDPMMGSPAPVDPAQLRELGIQVTVAPRG